jgi:peptide methionine sulfoxide reductase MsrA
VTVSTDLAPATFFEDAEEYHQGFYTKGAAKRNLGR